MRHIYYILPLSLIFQVSTAFAGTLSAEALYHRCYSQVTQMRASASDSRLAAVKAGTKDPIVACLEVLDTAKLTGNSGTTLANTTDPVAISILRNFQSLHYSWFHAKQFDMLVGSSPNWLDSTFDMFDPSSPALYYTKALFDSTFGFASVVTSNMNLRPIRSAGVPTKGVYSGASSGTFGTLSSFLVQTGDLIGISTNVTGTYGSMNYAWTAGGGFMGSIPYMSLTVGGDFKFSSNGAVGVPRRWGRDVLLDALCRPLPAARQSDVTNLVVANASAPFRQSSGCTTCHASMDRMAGVIRNFQYISTTTDGNAYSPVAVQFKAVTKTAETSWPTSSDSSFSQRPPNGVLFYRAYDGTLIEKAVTSVSDLGTKIAAEDDFYICAAQRYLHYFTGMKAEIGDIADPAFGHSLSTADLKVRQIAIDLGKSLKTSKSTRKLIEEILKLPQYKLSDYGLEN